MSIIQISKIQQRSGKLIDLPQLSDAEFGWATDSKRLFIGKSYPNENVEVLTSYSNISFSQVEGSGGNNLSILNAQAGQILGFDGTHWINKGGNAAGTINLGSVSDVKITGGAIGYTLETDGTGNLSWTPKSTIVSYISNATKANPVVITTTDENFFTDALNITITGVVGMTELNGNSFYVNVLTSNTFALYSDPGLITTVNGTAYGVFPTATVTATASGTNLITVDDTTGFVVNDAIQFRGTIATPEIISTTTYYVASVPNGTTLTISETVGGAAVVLSTASGSWDMYSAGARVISTVGGGGASRAGGANTTVQYNNNNLLAGSADFTFNVTTKVLAVSNTVSANLLTGTLTTVAQPNITTVGRLTTLVVGNATANTTFGNGIFTATGNANVGNLGTAGLIVATGNVTGGNLLTSGLVSAVGNVSGANLGTTGLVVATGNVTGGNLVTTGKLSVTGNANVGNLGTAAIAATGVITAVGTITGGGLSTSGVLSVTGNANVGNLGSAGALVVTGNANVGNLGSAGLIVASGNITGANLVSTGVLTVTGNAVAGNIGTAGNLIVIGNVSGGNINGPMFGPHNGTVGAITANTGNFTTIAASGNINAANVIATAFYGAGTGLTNIPAANIIGAVSNTTFAVTANTAGTVTTNAQPNITSVGTLTSLTTTVITTGANVTPGTITGDWTLTAGSKLQSTYADLAENYVADIVYPPGTVLEFGGTKEVTLASNGSSRVAGVVSTNPAYVMNAGAAGPLVTQLALQGRVPCQVIGNILKGDMLVSAGGGVARPDADPKVGTVIGKALQNFNGTGVIEVAVGRI